MTINRREIIKAGAAAATLQFFGVSHINAQSQTLITRPIPISGEKIPVIGIGTNRYGIDLKDNSARKPLLATLKKFHALGGRVIDTAPRYRGSESVLGHLISELGIEDDLFMATKCNMATPESTKKQIADSIKNLQWDSPIDLMQIHSMENWEKVLPAIRTEKQAGRLRYVGVTTSRSSQHEDMADLMHSESVDFVQLNYSLVDRNAEHRMLPIAAERGIAVMVNLPFGRGRLFEAVGNRPLPTWASEFDCSSWAQFFLKYVVSHPAVTCAIPGTRKVHHIEDNMAAAYGRLPSPDLRKRQENYIANL